jgi:hypothetical protein
MSTTQPTLDPRLANALRAELVNTVQASPTGGTVVPLASRSSRRRTGTRIALVAASVTGLAISASLLTPGPSAYAGWSATPSLVGGEPAQDALLECSARYAGHYQSGTGPTVVEPTWSGGLVEQRGRWQMTLVRGEDGTVAMCMHNLPDDLGSTGGLHLPKAPAPASFTVIHNGGFFNPVSRNPMINNGWFGEPEMEGHHYISGVAGEQVTGIVLHTVDGDVTASMAAGLWAAWWPVAYPTGDAPMSTGPTGATVFLADGGTVELDAAQLEELHDLDS